MDNTETQEGKEWTIQRHRRTKNGQYRDTGGQRMDNTETRWDPKDGELCLSRTKPEETLVEVRSDSDVQIDRQTWV